MELLNVILHQQGYLVASHPWEVIVAALTFMLTLGIMAFNIGYPGALQDTPGYQGEEIGFAFIRDLDLFPTAVWELARDIQTPTETVSNVELNSFQSPLFGTGDI